ncbi:MAG: hypothetical protein DHS20C09_17420 [marine bacterium B5-7]|nr:MAG: hypothetical protein DHS20C09_17420 [marine bacterium B5-7]
MKNLFMKKTLRIVNCMVYIFISLSLLPKGGAISEAYNISTHQKIVIDAVDFIIRNAQETSAYPDGSTGQSDFRLLRSILTPQLSNPESVNRNLREYAKYLAKESGNTDLYRDVWLESPGAFGLWSYKEAEAYGVSFTVFSHFLNIHDPGIMWPYTGYYFDWVRQNEECSGSNTEDVLANYLLEHTDAKLDVLASSALIRYKDPLLNVDDAEYREHYSQQIQTVYFWPITNLANYWYAHFVQSPKDENGTPLNLKFIGPVLHAAGDTTVPHHASGLSGCGHGTYESSVWTFYESNVLYDPEIVKSNLMEKEHLKSNLPVEKILFGNAKIAGGPRFCHPSGISFNCPIGRDKTVAKELVNLSIASTVILIRKSFSEWQKNKDKVLVMEGGFGEQKIGGGRGELGQVFYSKWSDVPISVPQVLASNPSRAIAVQAKLNEQLQIINSEIVNLSQEGNVESSNKKINRAMDDAATTISQFPPVELKFNKPGSSKDLAQTLPELGPKPIEFRPPSIDEIENDTKWQAYNDEREKFYISVKLSQNLTLKTILKGKLQANTSKYVKDEVKDYISILNDSTIRLTVNLAKPSTG